MIRTSIDECSEVAGTHIATAYRSVLDRGHHPGYQPLGYGGSLLITGENHPMGNSAIGPHQQEIRGCAEALSFANVPALITLTTNASAATIQDLGFAESSVAPTMAVELERLPRIALPTEYRFEKRKPGSSGDGWIDCLTEIFGIPRQVCQIFSPSSFLITDAPDDPVQYFQVTFEGKVVAASMMVLADGVAGMYCVGTLAEHRGKGLGAVVTAEPLRQSRLLGYKIGVLQASKLGFPVYERLGFQQVGEIRNYVRTPVI